MRVLADTHIALWSILDSSRLSSDARRVLASTDNLLFISYVSAWEVAIKHCAHPDRMVLPARDFVELCRDSGYRFLPIGLESITATEDLVYDAVETGGHKDPFDRLLLSQARSEGMAFLTHDQRLAGYGLPFVLIV